MGRAAALYPKGDVAPRAGVQLHFTLSTLRETMRTYIALSGSKTPSQLHSHFEGEFVPEVKKLFETSGHSLGSAANLLISTAAWMKPTATNLHPGVIVKGEPGSAATSETQSIASSAGGERVVEEVYEHCKFAMYNGPIRISRG